MKYLIPCLPNANKYALILILICYSGILFSQIRIIPDSSNQNLISIKRSLYPKEFLQDSIITEYYDTKLRASVMVIVPAHHVSTIKINYAQNHFRGAFKGLIVGAILGIPLGLADWSQNAGGFPSPEGPFIKPYTFGNFIAPVITISSISTVLGLAIGSKKHIKFDIHGDQEVYLKNLPELNQLIPKQ